MWCEDAMNYEYSDLYSYLFSAGEIVLKDWPVVEGPLPDGGDDVCVVCLGGDEVKPCQVGVMMHGDPNIMQTCSGVYSASV